MNLPKIKSKIAKDLKSIIPEFRNKDLQFNITQLPSKKNTVIHVVFGSKPRNFPKQFIIKIFRTKNIVSENNILTRLKNQNFNVPEKLGIKNIDLSKVPSKKLIKKLIGIVKKKYPNVYMVLVEERNKIMAKNLSSLMRKFPEKKILAVIGAGHEDEILDLVKKDFGVEYSYSVSV